MAKVAFLIGHDEKRQGAVSSLGQSEYSYNSEVASAAFRLAKNAGLDAKVFTRNNWGIKGAYKAINKWIEEGEDGVAIELHFNAYNKTVRGTETLFDDDPADSIEFARHVHDAVCDAFKRKGKQNRGIKKRLEGAGAYNLAQCEVPGCIIEPFFGDNPDDAKLGKELLFEYAQALVDGTLEYFKYNGYVNGLN